MNPENMGLAVSIGGIVLAAGQAIFLFLWNNLRGDIKEIGEKMDKKADKTEVDQRRDDIKDLYREVALVKASLAELERRIMDKLGEIQQDFLSRPSSSNGRSRPRTGRT